MKLIGGEGFKYRSSRYAFLCFGEKVYCRSIGVFFFFRGYVYLEQGTLEADLHIYGIYNEQFELFSDSCLVPLSRTLYIIR